MGRRLVLRVVMAWVGVWLGAGLGHGALAAFGVGRGFEARAVAPLGRGVASGRYLSKDPAVLDALHAGWAYNWSATPPPRHRGLEWVPMVWGSGSVTSSSLATLTAAGRSGRAHELLGFNEPDSRGQSNLSPSEAARLWPALERTGLRLGSPATAVPTDGWLTRFMALARARKLRVDFIALHYYQDFTDPNAVPRLRRQLIELHRQFHLPLWITEIGAIDLRTWGERMLRRPTDALATGYMRNLFAMLDGLRFVQRYAWFMDNCWSDTACRYGSLFDGGGRLTPAGATFARAP